MAGKKITDAFLVSLPKTDLHVHLDGSLRAETLIDLAQSQSVALPSFTTEGLRELVFKDSYADLVEYLRGFIYTTAVLRDPESLERVAYELAVDNLEEGVRYVEARFAPQLHIREGFDIKQVIEAVSAGMERAKRAHNAQPAVLSGEDLPFEYGIIVCALRWFNPQMSAYYKNLFSVMSYAPETRVFAAASLELARAAVALRDETGLPIVGFDLAGAEAGHPAVDHVKAYLYAHQHFIKKTVHAGEAYGPESIFQAITDCHANRIGHGTHLYATDKIQDPAIADRDTYVEQLSEYIGSQRISIEVNLTSNLQTLPELEKISDHPLSQMLAHKLSASICTDNRLVSNTTVTRELSLAVNELNLNEQQLRSMIIAGFKGSFFPGSYREKRAYVRKVIDRYNALEREFLARPDAS